MSTSPPIGIVLASLLGFALPAAAQVAGYPSRPARKVIADAGIARQ